MFEVTKEFKWDMAHRLVKGYKGKCSNIHGHTWRARFTFRCRSLNKHGMVIDFNDLKGIKGWIDANLDHSMMLCTEDRAGKLLEGDFPVYLTDKNPTCEEIARALYVAAVRITDSIAEGIELPHDPVIINKVEVWESPTGFATYYPGDK